VVAEVGERAVDRQFIPATAFVLTRMLFSLKKSGKSIWKYPIFSENKEKE
jgi:hypothetical protein